MPGRAPVSGGFAIGGDRFFVDGDFTKADPAGLPEVSFPMMGDSILTYNDLLIFVPSIPAFQLFTLGNGFNVHPWSPNQQVIVIEQEFMVAQESYEPMHLNTPYNTDWALGWIGYFPTGYPAAALGNAVLVKEGELVDMGAGISRIKRKWATIPPTRCEIEQYAATFPGLDSTGGITRQSFTQNVASRLQYDYFIVDFLDILSTPTVGAGGNRIDSSTHNFPSGLVIPAQQYFDSTTVVTSGGIYVGNLVIDLNDSTPTLPTATQYIAYATGTGTSNGLPAEIVAEASTLTRWMGNIWERRTRFVAAI